MRRAGRRLRARARAPAALSTPSEHGKGDAGALSGGPDFASAGAALGSCDAQAHSPMMSGQQLVPGPAWDLAGPPAQCQEHAGALPSGRRGAGVARRLPVGPGCPCPSWALTRGQRPPWGPTVQGVPETRVLSTGPASAWRPEVFFSAGWLVGRALGTAWREAPGRGPLSG